VVTIKTADRGYVRLYGSDQSPWARAWAAACDAHGEPC